MIMYYKLDGHDVVEATQKEMCAMMEDAESRKVAWTKIGGVNVSTVFLCIDHNLMGEGPPVLFETMIFGGPLDQEQERYVTWDEAVAGHEAMVQRVKVASKH